MPNCQEVGKENVAALEAWAATQSDEDFTQIICQGVRLQPIQYAEPGLGRFLGRW